MTREVRNHKRAENANSRQSASSRATLCAVLRPPYNRLVRMRADRLDCTSSTTPSFCEPLRTNHKHIKQYTVTFTTDSDGRFLHFYAYIFQT